MHRRPGRAIEEIDEPGRSAPRSGQHHESASPVVHGHVPVRLQAEARAFTRSRRQPPQALTRWASPGIA
jgi:hypothetical protein